MEAHVEDPLHAHYTIVVPKYAAEQMWTQAAEQDLDGEQSRMALLCEQLQAAHQHMANWCVFR